MKEAYFKEAQAEYVKMLGRFCDVEITELADEPLTRVKSEADERAAIAAEGARVLERLKGYVIACDIRGKKLSSPEFAGKLGDIMNGGAGSISVVIGGSLGLSPEVLARADLRLSFSDMTLPHRLFRVVLLEQLFRAFKILRGETYHK